VPHYYRVFGLSVESALVCPELLPSEPTAAPDITFRCNEPSPAPAGPAGSRPRPQIAPGFCRAYFEGVGQFEVRDGREITIKPDAGVPEDSLRTVLLGACLSILMHQRQLFVLHCSAVRTERGAVVFAGRSGTGKSTLVSAFLERGYRILADDMLALTLNEVGEVIALPGFPQVKLWADSAKALGRSTEGLRRVTAAYEKFVAPEIERFDAAPGRMHAIYILRVEDGAALALEPLGHTERFNALLDHTWQKLALAGLGVREWHFHTAARIASMIYAARLTRPAAPLEIKPAVDLIEADMQLEHGLA
jgi:hypothetical protein